MRPLPVTLEQFWLRTYCKCNVILLYLLQFQGKHRDVWQPEDVRGAATRLCPYTAYVSPQCDLKRQTIYWLFLPPGQVFPYLRIQRGWPIWQNGLQTTQGVATVCLLYLFHSILHLVSKQSYVCYTHSHTLIQRVCSLVFTVWWIYSVRTCSAFVTPVYFKYLQTWSSNTYNSKITCRYI